MPREAKQDDKNIDEKLEEILSEVRKLRDELKIFKINFQQTSIMGRRG